MEKSIEKVFWRRRLSKLSKKELTPIQTVRIVMFGLGGVGKTSLIHRFLFGKFDSAYTATIEDDYRQVITYNNHIVDVTVLDTAGSYQFPAMRKHAIQNGQGFLLVYAIDNKQSLDEVNRIYSEITTVKGNENIPPIIIVGNKNDKADVGKRKVEADTVNDLIRGWTRPIEHIETSAKNDTNVSLLFNKMIWIIDEVRVEKVEKEGKSSINFRTTYDQTSAEENTKGPNRTYSVVDRNSSARQSDNSSSRQSDINTLDPNPGLSVNRIETHRSASVLERACEKLPEMEMSRSRSLYSWEKSIQEDNETEKMKKKQRFLRKIFTRKSVVENSL